MDGEKLKQQFKTNYTEAFNFMKEIINKIDDGDDDDDISKPTTTSKEEEVIEIKIILSNFTSIDERSVIEDIKAIIIKIFESKNIKLKAEDISIKTKEIKYLNIIENNSIKLEIIIKVSDYNSKEEMNKIIKETNESIMKEELMKVNISLYENIIIKIYKDDDNSSNVGNENSYMILLILLLVLLLLN